MKSMAVCLGLCIGLTASMAFATKSRLEAFNQFDAFGQAPQGSLYIKDDRNVFLNPAQVNTFPPRITLEWGDSGSTTEVDADATPKAEGGFFEMANNFSYGVYLGNEDPTTVLLRNTADTDLLKPDNTLDLFLGSRLNPTIQWGANLSISSSDDETGAVAQDESYIGIKGGAIINDNTEAWAHIALKDQASGADATADDYDGELGISLGAKHDYDIYTFYGYYQSRSADYTVAGATTSTDVKGSQLRLGAARKKAISETDRSWYFTALEVNNRDAESGGTESSSLRLNLTLGAEALVKDWLELRGSVTQAALINNTTTETGGTSLDGFNANTTTVGAGLSAKLGRFRIDGSFSTTTGQFLDFNNGELVSRVAMTVPL